MGIYSSSKFYDSSVNDVAPASGYDDGQYSAQIMMIENCQNQLSMFNGTIMNDIQEASMRINGIDEEEIFSFSENALTSLLSKIKEMFKKLWSKIKAIFQGFMARLEATFGKNNKQFVEKYRKLVSTKDLTDFEPKFRKPKGGIVSAIPTFNGGASQIEQRLDTQTYAKNGAKFIEDWDEEKEADSFIQNVYGGNDISWDSFEKDFMDHVFDDEDTNKVSIFEIMSQLTGYKDIKNTADKETKALNKAMDKMIKAIEKDEDMIARNLPNVKEDIVAKKYKLGYDASKSGSEKYSYSGSETSKGRDWATGDESENDKREGGGVVAKGDEGVKVDNDSHPVARYQKALACVSKNAHMMQQVASKHTQCVIKALNFYNKQNRTIFAKAVAYKRNKNEEVMMEAFAELAEWEADY